MSFIFVESSLELFFISYLVASLPRFNSETGDYSIFCLFVCLSRTRPNKDLLRDVGDIDWDMLVYEKVSCLSVCLSHEKVS